MKPLIIDDVENPFYFITEDGDVYNKEGKLLTKHSTDGYYRVKLSRGCKRGMYRVNRLVAMTFIPNPNNYPIVHHIDGDRLNNKVSNLEWVDNSNNQIERFKIYPGTKCKPVFQLDLEGNIIHEFESPIHAEDATGIARQNISKVCRGKRKTAGGYKWRYVPSVETIEQGL